MANELILGLDIGGTKTAVVVGTSHGDVLSRVEFQIRGDLPFEKQLEILCDSISRTLGETDLRPAAISVSIGGPLDVLEGIIKSPPNLPGWVNIPLKSLLSKRFKLPVYVEHDGNAGALAEYFFGAGRGSKSIVFLTLGTGFGAGIILDGRLYRGRSFVAGEIGHIRIAEDGPDCYGKRGSLEGYCSGNGISKLAALMFPERWSAPLSTRELAELARTGDDQAMKVFETSGRYLGRAFAMLADMLNPEKIVLGALGFRLGPLILEPAMEVFRKEALREAVDVCEIVRAQLGEKIGDIASLCAAIDQGGMR